MVMKYADNILKGFALAIAIIVSCLVSVVLFNFQLTMHYVIGAAMVISSAFLYNKDHKPQQHTQFPSKSATHVSIADTIADAV